MLRLRRFRCALTALFASSVLACASEEVRFEEHMARAKAYRESEQPKEATVELRSALKLKPNSAVVNEQIAELARESGQFENAVFFYREAQRLDPQWIARANVLVLPAQPCGLTIRFRLSLPFVVSLKL